MKKQSMRAGGRNEVKEEGIDFNKLIEGRVEGVGEDDDFNKLMSKKVNKLAINDKFEENEEKEQEEITTLAKLYRSGSKGDSGGRFNSRSGMGSL